MSCVRLKLGDTKLAIWSLRMETGFAWESLIETVVVPFFWLFPTHVTFQICNIRQTHNKPCFPFDISSYYVSFTVSALQLLRQWVSQYRLTRSVDIRYSRDEQIHAISRNRSNSRCLIIFTNRSGKTYRGLRNPTCRQFRRKR